MEVKIDSLGRMVIPKPLREATGFTPGTTVDISLDGVGLALTSIGRTARLVEEDGLLVATGETLIDNDTVLRLIDSGRR